MLGFEGFTRELLLMLDGIQFFITLELGVLFLVRGRKKKKGGQVNYGWGVVFLCFGCIALANIYLYFYMPEELWYANLKFNSLIGSIPGLIIIVIMEKLYQKYYKTRFFFTIFAVSMSIITFFTDEALTSFLGNLSLIVLGIFVVLFYTKLIRLSEGSMRRNVLLFTISFFLFMFGTLAINPTIIETQLEVGINVEISGFIGRVSQIVALFIMAEVLLEEPVFYELEWPDKLIQLIIIHKQIGVHLFHIKFQDIKFREEPKREIQESLFAGGMMGISAMLKEISQSSKELQVIDHGDQKILLEHGEFVTIALNVLEELKIFWDKLRKIRETIDYYFGGLLKNFDGNLEIFKPLKSIILKEFT